MDAVDKTERGRVGLAKRLTVLTPSLRERRQFKQTMQQPVEEAIVEALGKDAAWLEKFRAAIAASH